MEVIRLSELSTCMERYLPLLPKSRIGKMQRMRTEKGRLETAAAGLLLRLILGADEDRDIRRDEFGKPGFSPESGRENECFSLSHSGNYAVLVRSDRPVGADVEEISRVRSSVMRKTFTPAERRYICNGDRTPEEAFVRVWTLKESIAKADGRGLGMDFREIETARCARGELRVRPEDGMRAECRTYDGHVFACAGRGRFETDLRILRVARATC